MAHCDGQQLGYLDAAAANEDDRQAISKTTTASAPTWA